MVVSNLRVTSVVETGARGYIQEHSWASALHAQNV